MIEKLIGSEAQRLRYVERFSACRVMRRENVAEHSYYTALYAMVIFDWLDAQGRLPRNKPLTPGMVLRKALLHDVEEARMGDIPRSTKYSDEKTRSALETIGKREAVTVMESLTDELSISKFYYVHWKDSKLDVSGKIVAFADYVSVLAYVIEEVRSSNRTILEHVSSLIEYTDKFDAEEYDFLRPLVLECRQLLHRIGVDRDLNTGLV